MKMIRIIPTDKYGKIYYGPKTYAQCVAAIQSGDLLPAAAVVDLESAGFIGVARRVRKDFNVVYPPLSPLI